MRNIPRRVHDSFRFAFHGIKDVFNMSLNFRLGLVIAILVIAAGAVLKLGFLSWVVVIFTTTLILAAETINTAAEKMLDFFHPEKHPEIGHVKDIMAAAVVICVIGAFLVGVIVFGNAILSLCHIKLSW